MVSKSSPNRNIKINWGRVKKIAREHLTVPRVAGPPHDIFINIIQGLDKIGLASFQPAPCKYAIERSKKANFYKGLHNLHEVALPRVVG